MSGEPASAEVIAREVLGVERATTHVAERLVMALMGSDPRVVQTYDGNWARSKPSARPPALDECSFAVVDVETTGNPRGGGGRVTEIAIVVVEGGEVNVVLDTLVNPHRRIMSRVMDLTGISQADVDGAPDFAEVAADVTRHLTGRVFVAHNVAFDWRFVNSELRRSLFTELDGPRLCTARLARRLIPGMGSRSLDSVIRYLGIEVENRHRAGPDALATARALVKLLDRARDTGVEDLNELIKLTAPRAGRKKRKRRSKRAMPTPMDEI